jgi:thioredoxin reductase
VIRTVDLVISGGGSAALAAAVDALQRGQRVLVVSRPGDGRARRRFRRCLCKATNAEDGQVTVMTGAEVVCVDGVGSVEAVVIRYVQTGRLCAVNASAFLSCEGAEHRIRGTRH